MLWLRVGDKEVPYSGQWSSMSTTSSWIGMLRSGLWLLNKSLHLGKEWALGSSVWLSRFCLLGAFPLPTFTRSLASNGVEKIPPLRALVAHESLPIGPGIRGLPYNRVSQTCWVIEISCRIWWKQSFNHTPDPLTPGRGAWESVFLTIIPGDSYHQESLENNDLNGGAITHLILADMGIFSTSTLKTLIIWLWASFWGLCWPKPNARKL